MLLDRTVRNAADQIPGYAHLQLFLGARVQLSNIHELPIIDKKSMLADINRFRNARLGTMLVQHTSGTTGATMVMHRSREEVEFTNRFFSEISGGGDEQQPICIALSAPGSHGESMPMPYAGNVFSFDPFDRTWMGEASNIVTSPWTFLGCAPGRAILTGLEPHLRILTAVLLDREYDFSKSIVQGIVSTGDLVTAERRRWYEKVWGVQLQDKYSLSEVLGGAAQCLECGKFHPDTHLVAEAIDPVRKLPVENGLGVLVFTTLFPFVQKQPLIRYWSGDLVEVFRNACPFDDLSFEVKGRLSHCLLDTDRVPLAAYLLGAEIVEVLEQLPDVAKDLRFGSGLEISDPSMLGNVMCSYELDRSRTPAVVVFRVELRYAPYAFPARSAEVQQRIRSELLKRHPHLAEEVRAGRNRLEVLLSPPGCLRAFRAASIAAEAAP
jgi:hypothetical protein